jgi:citrate lyase beta subunit
MLRHLELGASLYVPATRLDLAAIGNGEKYPGLRSVIFCLEDAIHEEESPRALRSLEAVLRALRPTRAMCFVRPRSPRMLRDVVQMSGSRLLAGFVLPKVTRHNLDEYLDALPRGHAYSVLPVLETAEAYDEREMLALRDLLLRPHCASQVLSLRIGGNDLLQALGMRRPRGATAYSTPLGHLIPRLVGMFRPVGLNLTGPVFEGLGRPDLLAREVRRDLAQGLFGKSAIHPAQVPVIEAEYRVRAGDLEAARQILDPGSPAVFQLHGAMCERMTHRAWAEAVIARAALYGVRPGKSRKEVNGKAGAKASRLASGGLAVQGQRDAALPGPDERHHL